MSTSLRRSRSSVAVQDSEQPRLAKRMTRLRPSAVREILKVAEQPDVLSFAGGLPAPELFPLRAIAEAHAEVFDAGPQALQYGLTEGFGPLREWLANRLGRSGIRTDASRVLLTTGSQQGIDLTCKVLLDPGDLVVVENPTYLAALQVFSGYEAEIACVGSDHDGMRVDELERLVARRKPKLVYVVPDFDNPKGTSLSLERRRKLVALAQRHGFMVLEDDPYSEIRFKGEQLAPLAALDEAGSVIYLGTFSKTLAPGLRIGWLSASPAILRAVTVAKQAADLHSSVVAQRAVARLLYHFDYDEHLGILRRAYAARSHAMEAALHRHFPPDTRWNSSEGGLFFWVALPNLSADALLPKALACKVAFVPGSGFFVREPRAEYMRLNFSNQPPEAIELGMKRLGEVVRAAREAADHGVLPD